MTNEREQTSPFDPTLASDPHRVVRILVAVVVGGLLLIASFNYLVNPRAEFSTRLVPPLTVDDPELKVSIYRSLPSPPEVVFLGSSTAAALPPDEWTNATGRSAFNFAIRGGSVADALAVSRMVAEQDPPPRLIIYGLALGMFIPAKLDRAELSSSPLGAFTDSPPRTLDVVPQLLRSIDVRYISDSVAALRYHAIEAPEDVATVAPDGHATFHYWEKRAASGNFDLDGYIAEREPRTRVCAEVCFTPEGAGMVRELVDESTSRGTDVMLVLMPLHPAAVELANHTTFPIFQAALHELALTMCGPGVKVYDHLLIESFGGSAYDFYDEDHFNDANARRLLRSLATGEGDRCRNADETA